MRVPPRTPILAESAAVQEADRRPDVNVAQWLRSRADERPGATAVVAAGGERTSYAELDRLADRVAAALERMGVGPGERVALALASEPLYLAVYFAAAQLGAILLPLNTRLAPAELAFQLEDSEACVAVHADELPLPARRGTRAVGAGELRALLPSAAGRRPLAPGGEAPQVLMYTSGTTGRPKGALLPHRKTLYNTLNAEIYFELVPDDVVLVAVPLFHSFGLKILTVPALFAGAAAVLLDRFDPLDLQQRIAEERATVLGAVPVMYQRMLRAGLDRRKLATLRLAFSAGAAIDVETIRALAAHGVRLRQGYGQTETSILCCLDDANALARAGSVGRPVRYGEIRIADEQGRSVPAGRPGEVVVRGPLCMLGYWRRPEETAAARIDGWHRTGDLGVMDEEGFVTLVGRLKELYISGGENVYPAEVERVLEEHPNVAEAAVVGVPDPEWGEIGHAYVVPVAEPFDAEELLRWARTRLAGYKLPRAVFRVRELPRTASGKVRKHELQALR
jgi:fatty-acyl-CoA synthase